MFDGYIYIYISLNPKFEWLDSHFSSWILWIHHSRNTLREGGQLGPKKSPTSAKSPRDWKSGGPACLHVQWWRDEASTVVCPPWTCCFWMAQNGSKDQPKSRSNGDELVIKWTFSSDQLGETRNDAPRKINCLCPLQMGSIFPPSSTSLWNQP